MASARLVLLVLPCAAALVAPQCTGFDTYCAVNGFSCGNPCGGSGACAPGLSYGGCDSSGGGLIPILMCTSIPAGYYDVRGSLRQASKCPGGTYNPLSGCTEGCACCRTCPPGTTSLSGEDLPGPRACTACPDGSWWDAVTMPPSPRVGIERMSLGVCTQCPAGTHTLVAVGNSSLDCLGCAPGSWASAGMFGATCNLCPAGTASAAQNATMASTCRTCPIGSYSDRGSARCTPCPPGFANPDTGGATLAACKPCDAGTFSGLGASTCQACPQGSYCPAGLAIACPPGGYGPELSATSVGACLNCSAGFFSATAGAASPGTCQACLPGRYSAKSGAAACDACPAGTANPDPQGASLAACVACRAGTSANGEGRAVCTQDALGTSNAAGVGAAAPPGAAPPETPWEHVQVWVLPTLSFLGCVVTYFLFGDHAVSVCAPALHERSWRGYAGCLAGSVAPCCCCVRGRAAVMSAAAGVLRRLDALKAERAAHAAAVTALWQTTNSAKKAKGDEGAEGAGASPGPDRWGSPNAGKLSESQDMVNPIHSARGAAAAAPAL